MSDLEPPDNVFPIRFKRSKDDLPTAPVKKGPPDYKRPFCINHLFEYDLDERVVRCTLCDRKFDAFEALDHLGRSWSAYDFNHRNVRGEIEELRKERERIAKQVSNLKAQRRRLVPNVRKDVESLRSGLWKHGHERNPEIAAAMMRTMQKSVEKILRTLDSFGDDEAKDKAAGSPAGGQGDG